MNHAGVWPAENSDAISLETAAELVRASWMREDGRAVWRTEITETLQVVSVSVWVLSYVHTYRSSTLWVVFCAKAVAAKADMAMSLYCIVIAVQKLSAEAKMKVVCRVYMKRKKKAKRLMCL